MADLPSVLFVDDEQNVLAAQRRTFRHRQQEWALSFAQSAAEALEIMQKKPAAVVVTDIMMPGINGVELAIRLRQLYPETRCLILTGSGDLRHAAEAVNTAGIFRFFLKPCDPAILDAGIAEALAARKLALPTVAEANLYSRVADQLPVGILIIKADGTLVSMNEQAATIIGGKSALSLNPGGLIRATGREGARRLSQAINLALADNRSQTFRLEAEDSEAFADILCALSPIAGDGEAALMMLLSQPEGERAPSAEILAKVYDLTPAEGKLMHRLALGETMSEAADACGITVSSARTYLKSIFGKTGVNRQTELVMRALALPQPRATQNSGKPAPA